MHATRRIVRTLSHIVDIAAIVVIAIALTGVVLGRVLPALGHPVFVVGGPSMDPALGIGDAIVLDQVEPADLAVGDVVSLRTGPTQAVYTHRIIRLAERRGEIWIETKGDANATPDPTITPASAVIGRVTHVVPAAGYLMAVLSIPVGVVFILATGALLITFGWWLDSLEGDRRRARHRAAVAAIRATPIAAPAEPAPDLTREALSPPPPVAPERGRPPRRTTRVGDRPVRSARSRA
jgi:signal peptidase